MELFMRKQVIILGSLLFLISLFVFCYQAIETEYGDLLITIKWLAGYGNNSLVSCVDNSQLDQYKSVSLGKKHFIKENAPSLKLEKNTRISEVNNNSSEIFNDVIRIRFTLKPGDLVFEYDVTDSVYTIQIALGIYNIVAEALDSQGNAVYRADTTEVLVEPNKSNSITLMITPNYPSIAPEFIGFSDVNINTSGEYLLLWSSVPKSESYRLEEDDNNTFGSSQMLYDGQDTTYQVTDKEDGTYYYRVRAENDISQSPWSDPIAFQVQNISELFIETDSLPNGTVDSEYAVKVDASGGLLPYNWEIISGSLPPGLDTDFSYENNVSLGITGSPTEIGTFEFTLEVTDSSTQEQTASKQLSITIDPRPLEITTESLKRGREEEYYIDRIDAQGGSEGDWSWSLASGSLPTGIGLIDKGEFARLVGIAEEAGTYSFTVLVTDNVYPDLNDSTEFTVIIDEPQGFRITTTSLPNVTAGVFYTKQLQAAGGTSPYTWSETSASSTYRGGTGFAEGIYIDANGLLDGTCRDFPTTDQIEFQVTDSSVPTPQISTKTFSLKIIAGALFLYTPTSPMSGTVSTPFLGQIIYLQGTPPLQTPWTFSGDWPVPGLSVSYLSQNYKLTFNGSPTTAGTYNFNVTIKDSSIPQKTRTDSFTIIISP